MVSRLRSQHKALWNPDMYHGWGKQRNYFEGWYVKLVDPTESVVLALIPGIAFDQNGNAHAFIQVLDGKAGKAEYHEFPAEAFQPSSVEFALQLGDNFFSAERVQLNLPKLRAEVTLTRRFPWPKMLGASGIMGWYSFVPFMECYHGVVSMDYQLEGHLELNGQHFSLDSGKGYMEKDWGRSFPSSWIWMQSNHFDTEKRLSLMASVARIPWLGSHFIGHIVGFLVDGKLYRFATYTGAEMQAEVKGDQVRLKFRDRKVQLEIEAQQASGTDLISPISGAMAGKVNESMQATLNVKLSTRAGEQLFVGRARNAGLEVAGPYEELLTGQWRR